jgi:hypothetical protein
MPKTKISEFSATPASNTDIDSINIAEGCAPSGINDAIRELMAQLKDFQTGAVGDSFNGPVGTTTAAAGAFTTLSSTGNTTLGDASGDSVTINGTATFANANPTFSGGTANGVAYLNGSKVVTSGSALTFDGTNLTVGTGTNQLQAKPKAILFYNTGISDALIQSADDSSTVTSIALNKTELKFYSSGSEQMRLTSTGLGIGTSSPAAYAKLTVSGTAGVQTGAGQQIVINAPTTTAGQGAGIRFNAASGANEAVGVIGLINETSGVSGAMTFHVYNAGANIPEYMRLSSLGNLGIGTDAPATKLVLAAPDSSTIGQLRFARSADVSYFWEIGRDNNLTGDFIFSNASGGAKTERMRLDSSGNLGIKCTPSTFNASGYGTVEFGSSGGSAIMGNANDTYFISNAYYNSAFYYKISAAAGNYNINNGVHKWSVAPSGTAGNAITFTQAMTLDASGNLVIGDTSADTKFNLVGGTARISGTRTAGSFLDVTPSNTGTDGIALGVSYYGSGNYGPLKFTTGGSERARIDSSGNLLVGTTNTTGGALVNFYAASTTIQSTLGNITSAQNHFVFANPNGVVGTIQVSGSSTSFNTSSDYRLKNTISPMTGALAKVALLKPCTYKWNADGSDGEGFIAHELAEVVPQCVTGEKDAVDADGNPQYQGIDTSFLVATVVAALQELKAEFDAYKASHP